MLPMGEAWAVQSAGGALPLVESSGWGPYWPCRGSARDVICSLSKRSSPLPPAVAAPEHTSWEGGFCGYITTTCITTTAPSAKSKRSEASSLRHIPDAPPTQHPTIGPVDAWVTSQWEGRDVGGLWERLVHISHGREPKTMIMSVDRMPPSDGGRQPPHRIEYFIGLLSSSLRGLAGTPLVRADKR